jgi:hypothetical protein
VDVAVANREKLRVLGEGGRPVEALVIDAQLLHRMEVVELDHLLRSHDGQAALLARIQPGNLDLGADPAAKSQVYEHHILDVVLQIDAPACAHRLGLVVQQVDDHGHVVRGQAPQRVFVLAHPAQVHAQGIDVEDPPQLADADQGLQAIDRWVIQHQVADHQGELPGISQGHHRLRIG